MGGLVARWFIEREDGNRVVRRLIMLGTPNNGSPWPGVVEWGTTSLAVGLNELSKVVWPASVLAGLVQATHWVKVTLAEMTTDSNFLKDLYLSPDPAVDYTLIVGNTSLIPMTRADAERQSRLKRLLKRIWSDQTKYDLADQFFGGSENDTAVSVKSMRHMPGGRTPSWDIRPVACDHVSYFCNPEGLKVLAAALGLG